MASVSGKWKAPRLADDARLEIQQSEQTSCCALGMMCYPPPAPGTLKNESRKGSERGDLSFRPPIPQGGNYRFSSPFRSLPVLPSFPNHVASPGRLPLVNSTPAFFTS